MTLPMCMSKAPKKRRALPFAWLEKATPEQQRNYQANPISLYWPDLEDGIDVEALITGNWTVPVGE